MDSEITGYHALTMLGFLLGAPFLLLSLNGPLRVLRWRREGTRAEGTIIRARWAKLESTSSPNARRNRESWCAVYRYTLPDGRAFESAITDFHEWRPKESDIEIGGKVPLLVLPSDPEKIRRADMPVFDSGDRALLVIGLLLVLAALPFWPKTAAAALALTGVYFALRGGFSSQDRAQ
jgi:hypothetical protein